MELKPIEAVTPAGRYNSDIKSYDCASAKSFTLIPYTFPLYHDFDDLHSVSFRRLSYTS